MSPGVPIVLDQEQSAKLLARLRQQNTPHYTHTNTEAGQRRIFISSSNTLLQLGPGPGEVQQSVVTPDPPQPPQPQTVKIEPIAVKEEKQDLFQQSFMIKDEDQNRNTLYLESLPDEKMHMMIPIIKMEQDPELTSNINDILKQIEADPLQVEPPPEPEVLKQELQTAGETQTQVPVPELPPLEQFSLHKLPAQELTCGEDLPTLRDLFKHGIFYRSQCARKNPPLNEIADAVAEKVMYVWTSHFGFVEESILRRRIISQKFKRKWEQCANNKKGTKEKRYLLNSQIDQVYDILKCKCHQEGKLMLNSKALIPIPLKEKCTCAENSKVPVEKRQFVGQQRKRGLDLSRKLEVYFHSKKTDSKKQKMTSMESYGPVLRNQNDQIQKLTKKPKSKKHKMTETELYEQVLRNQNLNHQMSESKIRKVAQWKVWIDKHGWQYSKEEIDKYRNAALSLPSDSECEVEILDENNRFRKKPCDARPNDTIDKVVFKEVETAPGKRKRKQRILHEYIPEDESEDGIVKYKGEVEEDSDSEFHFSSSEEDCYESFKGPSIILECESCNDFKTQSEKLLDQHMFMKHGLTSCQICGMSFSEFGHFYRHKLSHNDPIRCKKCGKEFQSERAYNQHMTRKHNTKNKERCTICGNDYVHLQNHIKLVHKKDFKKIPCPHCDQVCRSAGDLKKHIQLRHEENKAVDCPWCGKLIKDLDVHLERTQCNVPEEDREVKKKLKCELCSKEFSWMNGLKKHMKAIHEQAKDIHCDQCDYKTYSKGNLYVHVKRMHEGRAYREPCPHCPRSVVNLEYHVKTFHGHLLI